MDRVLDILTSGRWPSTKWALIQAEAFEARTLGVVEIKTAMRRPSP